MHAILLIAILSLLNHQLISGDINPTTPRATQPTVLKRVNVDVNDSTTDSREASSEVGTSASSTRAILQRISDRLTALQALDEQQLRRLETLEYKLTRLEVQQQEKMDGLRTDLRDVTRRMQQVDWTVSKMDTNVDAVKQDTTDLRQGQERSRVTADGGTRETSDNQKLQAVATSLYAVRGTLAAMNRNVNVIKGNLTSLNNITSLMAFLKGQCLTKQLFTASLVDLKLGTQRATTPAPCVAYDYATQQLPRDCWEAQRDGAKQSGVYKIRPAGGNGGFYAYCRMEGRGGGWTVIQHRNEGSVDFYRSWLDYKHGFGNIAGEFWLGLDKIHLITNAKVNELLIELEDFSGLTVFALYQAFAVGSEVEGYPITVLGPYEGDAGDSLSYHAGHKFSAMDLDNDAWADGNCAEAHTGGWWYSNCDNSNLNGRYHGGKVPPEYEYQGMYWQDWRGPSYSLRVSRISVRPYQEKLGNNNLTESDENESEPQATTTESSWWQQD